MERRTFLAALGAAAVACRRKQEQPNMQPPAPSASTPPPPVDRGVDLLDWELENDQRCVVMIPKGVTGKLPLLIALHGLGETVSPRKGAYGWLESYELDRALLRLRKPPLDESAFHGFVTATRLAEINADLAKRPFGGLVIACPYLPKSIGGETSYEAYGTWLGEKLIPKLRAEAPVLGTTASTGIDGVSLGGITALRIGLARADLFGVVGALQPAVNDVDTAESLAALIEEKIAGRPLRIVTSTEDAYRTTLTSLDEKLWARKVTHQFFVTEGPHDYVWNKGPGGIEMVLFHDRALRAGA